MRAFMQYIIIACVAIVATLLAFTGVFTPDSGPTNADVIIAIIGVVVAFVALAKASEEPPKPQKPQKPQGKPTHDAGD